MAQSRKLVSIIVPVHNEEDVLPAFIKRIESVLDRLATVYECLVVFVDDGSRDNSWSLICRQATIDSRFRGIRLSRNFGHQAAITCGYEMVAGDAVVTIDSDLQDPPEVILDLVASWEQGNKVVLAVRRKREGETWFKLITARLFYYLINHIAESDAPEGVGDFRLLDKQAVDALRRFPETHRYVRGLVGWLGFRRAFVEYDREPRAAGESKYSFWKMLHLAADAVVSLSILPLRVAYVMAFLCTIPFLAYLVYNLILHLFFNVSMVPGWSSLILAVIIFGSVNLVMFGILGEYVGRIYDEVKHRPLYLIEEVTEGPVFGSYSSSTSTISDSTSTSISTSISAYISSPSHTSSSSNLVSSSIGTGLMASDQISKISDNSSK